MTISSPDLQAAPVAEKDESFGSVLAAVVCKGRLVRDLDLENRTSYTSSLDDIQLVGDRESFESLEVFKVARAGICKGLIHFAEATPFKKRHWFSVSEIANARLPGEFVPDPQRRATIIEDLRDSIVKREFVDERNRLQVMNLHSSPHMGFRFDSDAARNSDWFQKSTEFVWIRRDILLSWWRRKYGVSPPVELCLDEEQSATENQPADDVVIDSAAHLPELSSDAQPLPQSAQKARILARKFAEDYVSQTSDRGQQPTQLGVVEAARNAGLRVGRQLLRDALIGIVGNAARRRGRLPKRKSPK